jgi:hypothetical protein
VLALDVGRDSDVGLPLLDAGRAAPPPGTPSPSPSPSPAGDAVRSVAGGAVIIRNPGTTGPPPPPGPDDPPVRYDRALATLELRLDDRGTGMLLCELPRSDRGGLREKSTGDVPSRLALSSLLLTLSG